MLFTECPAGPWVRQEAPRKARSSTRRDDHTGSAVPLPRGQASVPCVVGASVPSWHELPLLLVRLLEPIEPYLTSRTVAGQAVRSWHHRQWQEAAETHTHSHTLRHTHSPTPSKRTSKQPNKQRSKQAKKQIEFLCFFYSCNGASNV